MLFNYAKKSFYSFVSLHDKKTERKINRTCLLFKFLVDRIIILSGSCSQPTI